MPLVRAGRVSDPTFVSSNAARGGTEDYDFPGVDDDDAGAVKLPKIPNPFRKWKEHELADGVRLKVREGKRFRVTNRGTKRKPKWELEATGALEGPPLEEVGLFPLIPLGVLAAKAAIKGKKKPSKGLRDLDAGQSMTIGAVDETGALFIDTDGYRLQDGDDR